MLRLRVWVSPPLVLLFLFLAPSVRAATTDATPVAGRPAPQAALPAPAGPASLGEAKLPAYKLNLAADLPLLSVGALIMVGWVLPLEPARCAPLCDKSDLNVLDRPVAGFYDTKWGLSSDIGIAVLAAGVITTLFVDEGWKNGLNDLVVVLQSFVASNGLAIIVSLASRRPRPMLYSEKAPEAERSSLFNSLSFYSGHTAGAFSLTLSLFWTLHRRHPTSVLKWVVLGLGLTMSSMIAVGRVMSGKHFPSDVLVGAAIGSAFGIAIPALHGRPKLPVTPVVSGTGLGLAGTF